MPRALSAPMRWTPGGVSSDVEDRRGSSGFGIGGAPLGIGGAIVLAILSLVLGRNFFNDNTVQQQRPAAASEPAQQSPAEANEVQFVSFVLDDAQATWQTILADQANV